MKNLGCSMPKVMAGSMSPVSIKVTAETHAESKLMYVILVGGIPTPLKNMKVNLNDYSQYMEK